MSQTHSRSAWSKGTDSRAAAEELLRQLEGFQARVVLFFCSHRHDGQVLSRAFREKFPTAEVMGCTTAGEFTDAHHGEYTVTALALGPDVVAAAAGGLVDVSPSGRPSNEPSDVERAVGQACRSIEAKLGTSLRQMAPEQHVGLVLLEGLGMREEAFNVALGNNAPLLSFVGGSAGDNLEFRATQVFFNERQTQDGAALLVLKTATPFHVLKTCSFEPVGRSWSVTRADVPSRVVYELDGRPVLEVYAEALGLRPARLDSAVFMGSPLGLLIDGKPWIRSPQRALPDGGLKFYCQVLPGMQVHLMRSTRLVEETQAALVEAARALGCAPRGGVVFNCILRRLELDARGLADPFYQSFRGLQMAGFHTYGESWLGHINQTLTAVLFA